MKIDYISDIHIDTWQDDLSWLSTRNSTKLIIAGDIADSIKDVEYGLRKISPLYEKIYYIDGNHEYENCRFAYEDQKQNLRELCDYLDNVHFLPDNPVIIDNIGIVGCCGWWTFDFAGADPHECSKWLAEESANWSEYQNIGFSIDQDLIKYFFKKLSTTDYITLREHINQIYNNVNKIIVVTHTPCHTGNTTDAYPGSGNIKGLYGNSMMMNIALSFNKIKYWINGHCHDQTYVKENGIEFINNPRGRPWDFSRKDYTIETLSID